MMECWNIGIKQNFGIKELIPHSFRLFYLILEKGG